MPARSLAWFATIPLMLLAPLRPSVENVALRKLVERGRHPAIRWSRFFDVQPAAILLYQRNGWNPVWLTDNRPTAAARATVDVLATAADRGLDPEDYDAQQLAALVATLDRRGADAEQAIRFDAALTIAALRFTSALRWGRTAKPRSDPGETAAMVDLLRSGKKADSLVSTLEPVWVRYRDLKRALGRYRRFAKDSVPRRSFFQARIRQIEFALERWRLAPPPASDRVLMISGPAGGIEFADAQGSGPVLRVRVESPRCRRLPVFSDGFWYLVLRPAESPGTGVKLPLSDSLAIYGSPASSSPSHCLETPDGELLAERLLRDRADWTPERVRATIAGSRQVFVRLRGPVQVVYVYSTVVLEPDGQVRFLADEFGHDRKLAVAMKQEPGKRE
jgi:murein L,D-transpeptidase YcbB/YkuD